MIGKAFIPAAGLGTRLGDITQTKPKALVEVGGVPMLELTIERLKEQGFTEFMVNVHHFAEDVIKFINKKNHFGVKLQISDERETLLDTGGAILKAASFFKGKEPVLVHNVDILSEINFKELYERHTETKALSTLCVRKRDSGRALLFDEKMFLKGWTNIDKGQFKWVDGAIEEYKSFAFNGVYLASPEFPELIPFRDKFSIIDTWLKMAATENILGYHDLSTNWFDLGTPEKIKIAENYLSKTKPNH